MFEDRQSRSKHVKFHTYLKTDWTIRSQVKRVVSGCCVASVVVASCFFLSF